MRTFANGDLPTHPDKHGNFAKKINNSKLQQKNVQDSLELQKAILDSANYSIIATDVNGLICAFNKTAEKWLGYSASETIGKVTPECFHDLDEVKQRAIALTQELGKPISAGFEVFIAKTQLGQTEESEWTYIRKDGSRFQVTLSISILRNENDEISGFLGIANDITSRKQSEQELQKILRELAFQKFALDQSAIVAITDIHGSITYANNKFCEISGYTQDELLGKNHRLLNSQYHPQEFFASLWEEISNGKVWRGEIRNKKKNGEYYWTENTIVPLLDKDSKPIQYLAIRFDISTRKNIEEILRLRERAIAASHNGIVITDYRLTNNPIVYVNSAFEEITGYSESDVMGKNCRFLQGDDVFQPEKAIIRSAVKDGISCTVVIRNYRKDGTLFWNE